MFVLDWFSYKVRRYQTTITPCSVPTSRPSSSENLIRRIGQILEERSWGYGQMLKVEV